MTDLSAVIPGPIPGADRFYSASIIERRRFPRPAKARRGRVGGWSP
jgi:hypothetical protein